MIRNISFYLGNKKNIVTNIFLLSILKILIIKKISLEIEKEKKYPTTGHHSFPVRHGITIKKQIPGACIYSPKSRWI